MNRSPTAPSFLLFLLHLSSIVQISRASDTINTTQMIRDGDTIVSSAQSFELGFFSPGSSTNRYVGIWYRNITKRTPVWVANREFPLRNTMSGVLMVNSSGRLVILNQDNSTIWFSDNNTSTVLRNPIAQLLDSGNLVIREANGERPESTPYVWQSFDYPTDTILLGMDFGWNLVTGWERYISSWAGPTNPSKGNYTAHLVLDGYPQVIIKRGGILQCRIGPWNGVHFSGAGHTWENPPTFTARGFMNSSVAYFREVAMDRSVVSRNILNTSGILERLTWVNQTREWVVSYVIPADECDTYGFCGVYGVCNPGHSPICRCLDRFAPRDREGWKGSVWSGGCVRRTPMSCRGDVFVRLTGVKMPDSRFSRYNENLSLTDCEQECLRDCNCTAYSNLDITRGGSGCLLFGSGTR